MGLELGPQIWPLCYLAHPLLFCRGWVSVCPAPQASVGPQLLTVLALSPISPLLCPFVPLSASTSDIVFFGENLPSRFFSCMQSVSAHSGLGPCEGNKARAVGSKSLLATPRRTSRRWTSSSSWAPPCRCSPSPLSSASRLRRMGLGVSCGQGTRADPESQLPLPRAPLATPRLLINKEKTGQVSLPQLPLPLLPHFAASSRDRAGPVSYLEH